MILHGGRVQNWRNIGHLELENLGHPLVVLHGPNRTGKSSLVDAIRTCLLDRDYDSTERRIREAIPWQSKLPPEVSIEFETGGVRYRIMKRFSRGREGDALLERRDGTGQWTVLERKREAGRAVQQLLGMSSSESGLNQLLWVDQGQMELPKNRDLDDSLQKQLQAVLGSLLTGQDWDFYRALEKACTAHFTPKGDFKKSSPVSELQQQLETCRTQVAKYQQQSEQSRRLLESHEHATLDSRDEERRLRESEGEVRQLELERAASQSRWRDHAAARAAHAAAVQALSAAEKRSAELAEARARRERTRTEESQAAAAHERAEADCVRAAAALAEATQLVAACRTALEQCEAERRDLADQQRWLDLAVSWDETAAVLREFDELAAQIQRHDAESAGAPAPSAEDVTQLRKNRREAVALRADLAAAELQLCIVPRHATTLSILLDGQPGEQVTTEPGHERTWSLRQRVEIDLPEFGTIRIQRGTEDVNLEQSAARLAELDRHYHGQLAILGIDSDLEDALEQLDGRRLQQEELSRQRQSWQTRQQKLAPQGRGPLAARLARLEQERQSILERAPAAGQWSLQRDVWEARQREFTQRESARRAELTRGETALREATRQERTLDTRRQESRVRLAECRSALAVHEAEGQRLDAGSRIQVDLVAARQEVDLALQRLDATALSPAEQTIDERLEASRSALERRRQRLTELHSQCHRLEGELLGLSGLHENLAAAETDLAQTEAALAEQTLDAEAHKLLKELFENCRDQQVQRTTGLIERQVLSTARRLGLEEFGGVDFGTGYLPESLRRADTATAVALASESYGTTEQLALLVRLAVGGILARDERQLAILDDPLTHTDSLKQRRMLEILESATRGLRDEESGQSVGGPLQIVILTCHRDRFDHLREARQIDLAEHIRRS